MAATAKTTAMYEAASAKYARLVSYGGERLLPQRMSYLLTKLQDLQKWATQPVEQGYPDLPASQEELEKMRETVVMQKYRTLIPEMETVETQIRKASPGGLPEEKLIMPDVAPQRQPTKGIPTVVWVVGGLALVGALWAWSRRD